MLVTPTAVPYDELLPGDIARVSLLAELNGNLPSHWTGSKRPSSEWQIHRAILASRIEMNAVVHAHPVHCTAISMTRRGIPPFHYMIAAFGGDDVRCSEYADFGTNELSIFVTKALEDRTACLMANHGMVACGRTLAEALRRAVDLEVLATQYLQSLVAGRPKLLSKGDIAAALARFGDYRP